MITPVRQQIEGKRHKRSVCFSDSTKKQIDDINLKISERFGTRVSLNVLLGLIVDEVWKDMVMEDLPVKEVTSNKEVLAHG